MADIPRVRLNVDDMGYAGPWLPDSPGIPDLAGPAMGGGGMGIPREFMQMLAEAHAMRQRQAAMQLSLMREDVQNQRRSRDTMPRGPTLNNWYGGGRAPMSIGPQELGEAAASTLDPGNRLGRVGTDFSKLGKYMQFLGPEQVGAGTRTAGQGFAGLAGQASANAPELARLQGPDRRRQLPRYGFLEGSLPGTVPKTGNYQLHRGEVVVSEPQVDEPLIAALVEDKMRKGITGKNPKGARSYERGSIPPDSSPAFWEEHFAQQRALNDPYRPTLPVPVRPETGFVRGRRLQATPPGWEMGLPPEETQPRRLGSGGGNLLGPGREPLLLGPGEGGMTPTGPGVGPYGAAGGASAGRAKASRKLLGPGSSTDDIIEVLAKATGNPKASYKGVGKYALLGAAIGFGLLSLTGDDEAAADIPGAPQATPPPQRPVGPKNFSERLIEASGVLGGIPEDAGGRLRPQDIPEPGWFERFTFGDEAPTAPAAPAGQDLGSQSTSPSRGALMGGAGGGVQYQEPDIPENLDLAVALSRARGRDFGTPKDPLTLSGSSGLGPMTDFKAPPEGREDDYKPEAERGFAPESAEWRQAESQRTMAALNRQKADRIRDYLLSEGENMDSDTRKDLMHGADWLDSAAEAVERRHQERQEKREELVSKSQDAIVKADAEIRKATAKGEEVRATIAQKSLDELEDYYQDMQKSYVDIKGEADARGRERMLRAMAQTRVAQSRFYGEEITLEEAMLNILQELEPELYQEAVEAGE